MSKPSQLTQIELRQNKVMPNYLNGFVGSRISSIVYLLFASLRDVRGGGTRDETLTASAWEASLPLKLCVLMYMNVNRVNSLNFPINLLN